MKHAEELKKLTGLFVLLTINRVGKTKLENFDFAHLLSSSSPSSSFFILLSSSTGITQKVNGLYEY